MKQITFVKDSKEWKDKAVGYRCWRVHLEKCRHCKKSPASYKVWGTYEEVKRLAEKPENDNCERCS